MRILRWAAYLAIAAIALAWGALWLAPTLSDKTATLGAVSVGGPFHLTDQNGQQVTDATYRGRFMLVYFGYTFCPDVCPTELQTLASALDLLGPEASRIAPIFITVDPERDTVAALKDYVALFDKRLIGLTGTPAEAAAAAKAYRVYYAKSTPKDSTTYLMDHSSFIYLMSPDGSFLTLFRQGTSPDDLAKALRTRLAG